MTRDRIKGRGFSKWSTGLDGNFQRGHLLTAGCSVVGGRQIIKSQSTFAKPYNSKLLRKLNSTSSTLSQKSKFALLSWRDYFKMWKLLLSQPKLKSPWAAPSRQHDISAFTFSKSAPKLQLIGLISHYKGWFFNSLLNFSTEKKTAKRPITAVVPLIFLGGDVHMTFLVVSFPAVVLFLPITGMQAAAIKFQIFIFTAVYSPLLPRTSIPALQSKDTFRNWL